MLRRAWPWFVGHVGLNDLSRTDRQQWPTSIMDGLPWMQSEFDCMCAKSKLRYKSTPTASCSFCGKWIKNDMHQHVAKFHLDLGQLWRCPVSWCTVWKGKPQYCMDHLRRSHSVSSGVKTACLAQYFPPWTVRHEIWTDALKPCNLGISTDVLQRIEPRPSSSSSGVPRGIPHVSLRRDYLTRLRVFVSQASAMDRCGQRSDTGLSSPAPASSGSPLSVRQHNMGLSLLTQVTPYVSPGAPYSSSRSLSQCAVAYGCFGSGSGRHHLLLSTTYPACHCSPAGYPGPLCGSLGCVV